MSAATIYYRRGGEMESKSVAHMLTHGERTQMFRRIPAYVGTECGERSFEGSAAAQRQRLVRDDGSPTATVSVDVCDLAAASDASEARPSVV